MSHSQVYSKWSHACVYIHVTSWENKNYSLVPNITEGEVSDTLKKMVIYMCQHFNNGLHNVIYIFKVQGTQGKTNSRHNSTVLFLSVEAKNRPFGCHSQATISLLQKTENNQHGYSWKECVHTDLCSFVVFSLGVLLPEIYHKNRVPSAEPAATNRPSGLQWDRENYKIQNNIIYNLLAENVPLSL